MDMEAVVGLGVAVLFAIYLVTTSLLAWARERHYRRLAYIEATRSRFAEARAALIEIVREGRLSCDSATFQSLYQTQTFIVRRPQDYDAVARFLREQLGSPSIPMQPAWVAERETWPKELNDVFYTMARGLTELALGNPGFGRIARVAITGSKFLGRAIGRAAARRVINFFSRFVPRARQERDILEAESWLEKLARNASGSGTFPTISVGA